MRKFKKLNLRMRNWVFGGKKWVWANEKSLNKIWFVLITQDIEVIPWKKKEMILSLKKVK